MSAADAARQVADAVRELNYATLPQGFPGLDAPCDAYDVLGALSGAVFALRQAAGQLAQFLDEQAARPGLYDDWSRYAGRPADAVAAAAAALGQADRPLAQVADLLARAQQAVSGLAVRDGDEGGAR